MTVDVLRNVFERNDQAATRNRERFDAHGLTCINLLGGAGSGKTTLLEGLLPGLASQVRVGVLEGDLATTKDAQRIAALDVPVVQLLTEGGCHLSATLVQHGLDRLPLDVLDVVFIENVGNPICPANFDLGEHLRISVLSVTEGDDKPAKYPLLFKNAALVVLTKCDLLPHTDFDVGAAVRDLHRMNPRLEVIRTARDSHASIEVLTRWVLNHREAAAASATGA